MNEWQPIDHVGKSGKLVLIHYKNRLGNSRIIRARFIHRFTEEAGADTEDCGCDEYDELHDRYTYMEGWYEDIDNHPDYGFCKVSEGEPDAWMLLPAPPKASP